MKCPHLKQALLVLIISTALFTYLVLAANYAPMLYMSFSKKLHPIDLPNRPVYEQQKNSEGISLVEMQNEDQNSQAQLDEEDEEEEVQGEKGPPRVVILWTTWRSGSTFLGQLLANAVQDTFYSVEPLHYWKVNILHEDNLQTSVARKYLHNLLRCRITWENQPQIDYMSRQGFYMKWNTYFSRRCRPKRACAKRKFVNRMCRQANIHIAKVLRLPLKSSYSLLEDEELDLKIVYVARDPRAVLLSRVRVGWCISNTCRKPEVVCDLLEDDLTNIQKLTQTFPEKFKFMQYEKISIDPEVALRNLMAFLQLPVSEPQLQLLHPASTNPDSLYSTKKNPKTQSERWRLSAAFQTVRHIQNACTKPLLTLGLPLFTSKAELRNLSRPLVTDVPTIEL